MTVDSTPARKQYATNGTTGPWSVPFRFLKNEHLEVVYTDAGSFDVTLFLGVDFTVTGAGAQSGGVVTTTQAYPAGGKITIVLAVPIEQQSDYVNGDSLPEDTLEGDLDQLTMIAKQLDEQVGRAITMPVGDVPQSGELPPAAVRVDRFLVFDLITGAVTLSQFTQTALASLVATFQAGMATAASAVTYIASGLAAVAMSVQDRLRLGVSYPEEYGAVGDGASHPLSARFPTLLAAQAMYGPAAVALTDETDGVVLQYCVNNGIAVRGRPNKVYLTSRGLWVNQQGSSLTGARRWAGAASTQKNNGTSTLRYVGPGGANSYVALLSTAAVTVKPTGGDANLQNVVFKNWTLDANDVAQYAGIFVRAFQGNDLDNLTFTQARVCHSVSIDGFVNSPRNWTAFLGRGAGFWCGPDPWGWGVTLTSDDEVSPQDWFAYFIGVDPVTKAYLNVFADDGVSPTFATYPASANPAATCGIAIYGARGFHPLNLQVAYTDGPGIYIAPSLHGPIVIDGGYLENTGQSSNASRNWTTWTNTNPDSGSWAIRYRDIAFQGGAPAHRITGTQPSRVQEGLKFENCPIMGTVVADLAYTNWGMVDSDPTVTIVGGYPVTPVLSFGGFSSEPLGPSFRYREGTFAPVLAGATGAGTGRTYSIDAGSWERVGRMVTVRGQILLTAAGTGDTGGMAITNLPFTVQAGAGYNAAAATTNSSGLAAPVVSLTARAVAGTTRLDFYKRAAAAAGETTLALADIGATTGIVFSLTYPTSDA
jgi:hypothetical protein